MPLTSGTRLGPYEVGALLGAGGMGEVYRATDTRLRRDVAIKVLPDSFAADPERAGRLAREAQVLAALNHPNIAAIYGLEEGPPLRVGAAPVHALVMELVEGPTLEERLRAQGPGPMPQGGGRPEPSATGRTSFRETGARFSPDGRWVAYASDESGRNEIFVAPFAAPGERRGISVGGGSEPRWRRDGREIVYVGPGGTMVATEVALDGERVRVGATRTLFAVGKAYRSVPQWDMTGDGQRFLFIVPTDESVDSSVRLIVNWPGLLGR